ncbi:hypothetical protein NTD81_12510 [Pseudomonas sp. 5P_3.1_Bac2]|nr:hypothetical protein [Pseudomonas sp. 5P_3.1_Bac2]
MALKNCKECKSLVSKKADKCPTCGAPQGPKHYSLGKLIALVLFGFFIYSLINNDSSTNRASKTTRSSIDGGQEMMAFVMCQKPITDRLTSPSSAKFPHSGKSGVSSTHVGGGVYDVVGYVDSQNGFGAMLRSTWNCKIKENDNKTWTALDVNISQ